MLALQGLKAAKVVIAFVSKEYALSDNCRLELQVQSMFVREGGGGGCVCVCV